MDKNTGGAKPKTGTNNNNSNGRSGGASGSQSTGAQSRNRSPRRDNGYASRSSGGTGHRGLRSSNQTNDSNNHATRNSTSDSGFHRPSMPNSVARSRNATSSQGRSNALPPLPLNDYSPLRGGRSNGRQASRQHGFGRPVLRQQNTSMRSVEPRGLSPLEGPSRNVPSVSPSLHGLISSSEDSDSESGSSPMSPPSHQSSASLTVMSDPRGIGQRPMSMSPDAVVARELLQAEMDMMLQRDEEIARQLQEEIDHEDEDEMMSPLARPLSMFLPGGLQARGRHYPSIPGRLEGGLHRHGRDRRAAPPLRLIGPDRGGLEPLRFSRALRRHRLLGPSADSGPGPESGPMSPDQGGSPPGPEFDPDERVLAGDLDSPGDFLSVMNDPSLMLLMLLLRAPDTLHQNEASVDLDDYEALWELAERLGEVRRRGISEEQINDLPTLKYKPQNGEASAASASASGSPQCQICLVDFENGDCLRCIPCKHDFHKDCIDEWLKRNATCPICRQDVKPDDK